MQSLRDSGIVLVVILLAVSVRLGPLDETGQAADVASLTPQVEPAPVAVPFNVARIVPSGPVVPANAAILSTPEPFSILEWVPNDGEGIMHKADIGAVEHCTELLFHLRETAEQTRNEVIVLGAEEVIKVLPCSA
ncbi:MAG: hypothetical protein V3S47_01390 [Acidobacteriota bacterium]